LGSGFLGGLSGRELLPAPFCPARVSLVKWAVSAGLSVSRAVSGNKSLIVLPGFVIVNKQGNAPAVRPVGAAAGAFPQ